MGWNCTWKLRNSKKKTSLITRVRYMMLQNLSIVLLSVTLKTTALCIKVCSKSSIMLDWSWQYLRPFSIPADINTIFYASVTNYELAAMTDRQTIALLHVYVTQANFTTKPRFEIKNKRSFTEMNSQGSRVEKNTHAQKVQMQKILFTNEACWWNLLVWRNHA